LIEKLQVQLLAGPISSDNPGQVVHICVPLPPSVKKKISHRH